MVCGDLFLKIGIYSHKSFPQLASGEEFPCTFSRLKYFLKVRGRRWTSRALKRTDRFSAVILKEMPKCCFQTDHGQRAKHTTLSVLSGIRGRWFYWHPKGVRRVSLAGYVTVRSSNYLRFSRVVKCSGHDNSHQLSISIWTTGYYPARRETIAPKR